MKRLAIVIGFLAGAALLGGCADTRQTRLEGDFGTSHGLSVFNQTLNPEAESNLQPVEGLDGQAAVNNMNKYRDSFGKDTQPTTYTINIGK
jgi:hypothetical protein